MIDKSNGFLLGKYETRTIFKPDVVSLLISIPTCTVMPVDLPSLICSSLYRCDDLQISSICMPATSVPPA